MSRVSIDRSTGVLVVDGEKVFPLGVSNPPKPGTRTPSGKDGFDELAEGGVRFVRTGRGDWSLARVDEQLAAERELEDAAAAAGLRCWLWLGEAPNLPPQAGSPNEQLLTRIVDALKAHPALGAYKGIDEPAHAGRPAAGLVRAYKKLKELDADHPVVIIQAPRGAVSTLVPYRPAFDLTGADIFPIAYPPGQHSDLRNTDISVVGDVTRKMRDAAGAKPVWTTLQIAWSGVTTSQSRPDLVPRFPTLQEERFMAYQAIVAGARGLVFFGGHLTQIARPRDARAGWNWTFWELALKPLLQELTSDSVRPALVAPAGPAVSASASDVEVATREDGRFLYVIAVRRVSATTRVTLSGLPTRRDGSPIRVGEVLFEYVQDPLPPPIGAGTQVFRSVSVNGGSFRDWYGPHDVHVYRFAL